MSTGQEFEVPRPKEPIQEVKEQVLQMDTLAADQVYVALTPAPDVFQLTFHGSHEENTRHESWDGTRYRIVADLVRLNPSVQRLEASAVVTIDGWVHLDVGQGRWMHMKIEETRVVEDIDSHQVSVEFYLDLRGNKIGVLSYRYVAVMLVRVP